MNEQNFCNTVINGLTGAGYADVPNAVASELVAGLRDEALARRAQFRPAGIGNQAVRAQAVRGDSIDWLEWGEGGDSLQAFWQEMDSLRDALNRELYLGVRELECHLALYPPGGGYQKHHDNPQGRSARLVTVLLYLNPDWRPEHGGVLQIYDPEDESRVLARVEPRAGTFVAFLAERFPHEVLLAQHERLSLTGWWRRG
jgi:SM-20-related protein